LAVITGATGGVGLEIAKGLAQAGYGIILGARSEKQGTEAVTAIGSVAARPASIQRCPLDLASLASVAAFASALPDGPIDRLVLNAGAMLTSRKETEDGFEMMFGTNVLGHFALISHVLDRVLAAHAPRVITQSSESHRSGHLNPQDLQHTTISRPWSPTTTPNKPNTYWPSSWTAGTRTPAASSASRAGSSPISVATCPVPTCCSEVRTRSATSS
jgi:NAD(P)-dependent dehydrogenase (short-subunit alcohol dehydrogenase family)